MRMELPEPYPKQWQFIEDLHHKHLCYGGARSGGKSMAVRLKSTILSLQYAGIRCLIVRQTYPELINNHVNPLMGMLAGVASYHKQEKVFRFPNGSTISMGYCNNDGDLNQYQGAEYDIIFLEEATNLREEWIRKITACCRGTNGFPKQICYTCNPGGVSHGYIKRLFIDRRYEEGEKPEDYDFIAATVNDNKELCRTDPNYVNILSALPSKLRAAWLEGRWDVLEGVFFEEFREQPDLDAINKTGATSKELVEEHRYTHVIEPFTPDPGWDYYRSFDWGYGKPFSVGWWAVSHDGTAYRILEWYGSDGDPNEGIHYTDDQIFAHVAEIEAQHPYLKGRRILGVADPSIWKGGTNGVSTADTAEKHGVYFEKGNNERIAGWMQVRYRLHFDENGFARMYFFNTCKDAVRTLPLMMYDKHHVEDLDSSLEDHAADEIRYFCMLNPIAPVMQVDKRVPKHDPLNQFNKKSFLR